MNSSSYLLSHLEEKQGRKENVHHDEVIQVLMPQFGKRCGQNVLSNAHTCMKVDMQL